MDTPVKTHPSIIRPACPRIQSCVVWPSTAGIPCVTRILRYACGVIGPAFPGLMTVMTIRFGGWPYVRMACRLWMRRSRPCRRSVSVCMAGIVMRVRPRGVADWGLRDAAYGCVLGGVVAVNGWSQV